MSQKGLIYGFVAKGTVVLAEHTSFSGNFSTIAVQCLQKLPATSSKYTYSCDGYTFNFVIDNGFVFLVVADEAIGRSVPFVFLERVKDDFKQRYGASIGGDGSQPFADDDDDDLFEDRFSIAYNLDREFGPRLKEHMIYCTNHPEEISKLSKLKAQITEVKGIMMDNIEKENGIFHFDILKKVVPSAQGFRFIWGLEKVDVGKSYLQFNGETALKSRTRDLPLFGRGTCHRTKVLDRGERIELLVDKTENLQFQADSFQRHGRQLRRRMWLQNLKLKLMVGGALLAVIVILWLMVCRGFKC